MPEAGHTHTHTSVLYQWFTPAKHSLSLVSTDSCSLRPPPSFVLFRSIYFVTFEHLVINTFLILKLTKNLKDSAIHQFVHFSKTKARVCEWQSSLFSAVCCDDYSPR